MAKLAQGLIILILVAAVGLVAWTLAMPGKTTFHVLGTAVTVTPVTVTPAPPDGATAPSQSSSASSSFVPQAGQKVRLKRDVMIPLSYGMGKVKSGETVTVKAVSGPNVIFVAFGEDRTIDAASVEPGN